jgi:hypothetical protein
MLTDMVRKIPAPEFIFRRAKEGLFWGHAAAPYCESEGENH